MINICPKKILALIGRTILIIIFILGEGAVSVSNAKNERDPLTELWESVRSSVYIAPNENELRLSSELFLQLMTVQSDSEQFEVKNSTNLVVTHLVINRQKFIVIHEQKNALAGNGFYVLRQNGNGVLLQATHGFKDLHTGNIAIKMMLEGNYSALAINTIPRFYLANDVRINADMAHLNQSNFINFSKAFVNIFDDGQIVQLHGFNNQSRSQTQDTAMIISAGIKAVDQAISSQANCITRILDEKVLLYPSQINILGGTTNTIGRAVRDIGFSGFKHFEMSLPLRKKLLESRELRNRLSQCIEPKGDQSTRLTENK